MSDSQIFEQASSILRRAKQLRQPEEVDATAMAEHKAARAKTLADIRDSCWSLAQAAQRQLESESK